MTKQLEKSGHHGAPSGTARVCWQSGFPARPETAKVLLAKDSSVLSVPLELLNYWYCYSSSVLKLHLQVLWDP